MVGGGQPVVHLVNDSRMNSRSYVYLAAGTLVLCGWLFAVTCARVGSKPGSPAMRTKMRLRGIELQLERFCSKRDVEGLDLSRFTEFRPGPLVFLEDLYGEQSWLDSWGNPILFRFDSNVHSIIICSLGADGKPGGANSSSDLIVTQSLRKAGADGPVGVGAKGAAGSALKKQD